MTSTPEFKCIFCKESFDNKEELQIHFRKHGDPNFKQKNRSRVQSFDQVSNDSNKDETELVGCDVCSEMFPTISKAITHKHKVHPEHDAKYFCPWCGKLFTMKHLYNKHMQANHSTLEKTDRNVFHCDSCNVDFNMPTAMIYHNKFFHRQDTDIPTFGVSKKLKMYNQESLPIYYCSFCGEEYESKVNLHKHSTDDHNDENQSPDVVLRCPLCDAIFYHLDAYELHLTFHSSDDLYTERCELADDLTEYSLESVPPIMEKVENYEQDVDAETSMNGMAIEDFLEQALEEPDDVAMKKNKKHKKHKRSKKSAITLDEFLNMNKDVFGEGLDFQGVEEIPPRVINKKNNVIKKPPTVSEVNPELEKLRKHGIVIKKKTGQNVSIINKGKQNKCLKLPQEIISKNIQSEPIVSTSEDTIDKLRSKTNNQIRIVKKCIKDISSTSKSSSGFLEDNNTMECDSTKKDFGESPANDVSLENISAVENNDNKCVKESVLQTDWKNPAEHCFGTQLDDVDNITFGGEGVELGEKSNMEVVKETNSVFLKVESTSEGMAERTVERPDYDNVSKKPDENLNNVIHPEKHNTIDSLSSLKRLSHVITVKPVLSAKTDSSLVKQVLPVATKGGVESSKLRHTVTKANVCGTDLQSNELTNDLALKHIKNLHAKSLSPQDSPDGRNITCQEIVDSESDKNIEVQTFEPNTATSDNFKGSEVVQSKLISPKMVKISSTVEKNCNVIDKQDTTKLLKHLTGITAKPISTPKSKHHIPLPSRNIINKNVRKIIPQREIVNNEEIEIYNIDDSDDEIDEDNENNKGDVAKTNQPTDVLKNLSKNITIRSLTNTIHEKNKGICETQKEKLLNDKRKLHIPQPVTSGSNEAFVSNLPKRIASKPVNEKNATLLKTLKHLGSNVTIKSSNNCSTLQFAPSQDHNEHDRDSIKITEMTDEACDDQSENEHINDNAIVESPDDSHSEKEENADTGVDEADFEKEIEASMSRKDDENSKPTENEELLQNIVETDSSSENNVNLNIAKTLGNEISIKTVKQAKKEVRPETPNQIYEQTSSNSQMKQKMCMSNQVNKVNKQVMVKTFQTKTKTVIQEITTTVTKTITTVNQTLKEEVQNVNSCGSSSTLPQKVQGIRVQQQCRNLQGVVVRQSSPPVRPNIRTATPAKSAIGTTVRHSSSIIPVGSPVRPSNQIVPIRPKSNAVRPAHTRIPGAQKYRPATTNQTTPRFARPPRMSSDAIVLPVKRHSMEDTSGPFSCFKKPKESLIPVSDIPTFSNGGPESSTVYTSVSKSNSMSTVSTIKGNSVITNVKSEANTSSQQLNRLNTSGVKIMKTSQSKQAQVQETGEISASQRTTLEAIQKLQKQGLLVKKPRLDLRQDSDGSDHSGDNSTDDNE